MVRLVLIPVGDGEEIVRSEVRVAVFDARADRFVKTDRRLEMPAVMREARAGFPVVEFCEADEGK